MADHAVLIRIPMSGPFGSERELELVYALEDAITEAVESGECGVLDGHEIGGGEVVLFLYGPSADALYSTVEPVLRGSEVARGAEITRRYGPATDPAARQVKTTL